MKFTGLTAATIACCSAQQVAADAASALSALPSPAVQVYTYDPPSPHHQQPTTSSPTALSPAQARLVLAQRAGVEEYHNADLMADGVLNAINTYGHRTPLFESSREAKRAFILLNTGMWTPYLRANVSNDGTPHSIIRSSSSSSSPLRPLTNAFSIAPTPPSTQTQHLFLDLATQSLPDLLLNETSTERGIDALGCNVSDLPADAHSVFCIASSEAELQTFATALVDTRLWSVTALVSQWDLEFTKGEGQDWSYGTYAMPHTASALQKQSSKKRALPQKEAPLEEQIEKSTAAIIHSTIPVSLLDSSNSSSTVHGILPACFPSLSTCENLTSNCAGHGSCTLSYTNQAADSQSPYKKCYACSCSATTTTDSEGRTKTTHWGGPACQKKDISVEFWLFALFFVAMLGLIGFAVGEVWGMGDQELPSVIGAGVSGPVAKR